MKKLLFLILPFAVFADDLRSILEYAQQNNNLVKSYRYTKDAKESEVESKKSDYFPKIDIGASYKNTSDVTSFQISDIYSGYGRVEFDIYDGGAKSSQLDRAKNEYKASGHDEVQMRKNLSLQIVKDFYEIKSLEAHLRAKEDAKKSIEEQLDRIKQFYDAKLATQDDIDRLQASYDTNLYEIESINFDILSLKKSLELKASKEIQNLEESNFKEVLVLDFEQSDDIKSLSYKQNAVKNSAQALESAYYPKIKVEDSYTFYGYENISPNHPLKIDRQNVLMLSLNMRIFDYGATSEVKQSLELNSKAMHEQIEQISKEQKMQREIAVAKINSVKLKIKSSKSALVSASSAFKTINEKYNAGIVDYVIYLDALTSKTSANAVYERSLNELETAYALFYYYSGKNLEEFLK
ncbi:MAG: TolC family protein [Sulfurimonas sp.]|uniref:TolC family protein n=1 Tax=Sulfurimonas sp. TaxID=2022749 RepID=UPI00260D7F18|nr:TolC family protein [Sulfurimonas sp.]MDD5401547.1 TolC family protein [Sulfurimonas sp.]